MSRTSLAALVTLLALGAPAVSSADEGPRLPSDTCEDVLEQHATDFAQLARCVAGYTLAHTESRPRDIGISLRDTGVSSERESWEMGIQGAGVVRIEIDAQYISTSPSELLIEVRKDGKTTRFRDVGLLGRIPGSKSRTQEYQALLELVYKGLQSPERDRRLLEIGGEGELQDNRGLFWYVQCLGKKAGDNSPMTAEDESFRYFQTQIGSHTITIGAEFREISPVWEGPTLYFQIGDLIYFDDGLNRRIDWVEEEGSPRRATQREQEIATAISNMLYRNLAKEE